MPSYTPRESIRCDTKSLRRVEHFGGRGRHEDDAAKLVAICGEGEQDCQPKRLLTAEQKCDLRVRMLTGQITQADAAAGRRAWIAR
ncbi:hypothetical protein [Candidatus Poriferisodalis sp.]|uniref:hypothetical protein n=1 Tax=Candidatus Poriferisodalis sp. TaxID=3101277 RepID=UPI003B0223CD